MSDHKDGRHAASSREALERLRSRQTRQVPGIHEAPFLTEPASFSSARSAPSSPQGSKVN
jgi:hypothetical protein